MQQVVSYEAPLEQLIQTLFEMLVSHCTALLPLTRYTQLQTPTMSCKLGRGNGEMDSIGRFIFLSRANLNSADMQEIWQLT